MATIFADDVYAGLSGLEMAEEFFDLGEGIHLRKTYAHLMAPFMMAFKPAPPGGHHPAPWKAASGGFSFDVNAELLIPSHIETRYKSKINVARTLVFLLRLGVNPATTLAVLSNHPFSAMHEVPDKQAMLLPLEVFPRHFPLGIEGGLATAEAITWVKERWQLAHQLVGSSAEFSLAVSAIDSGQFVRDSALTLVSLWGAMESLFSPSTSELKFRVSSLIAAFLEPPGTVRASLQRKIAKLYDKRSAAAHGKPRHEKEDILETFNILRQVLMAIMDRRRIPTKDELEGMLFGTVPANESE